MLVRAALAELRADPSLRYRLDQLCDEALIRLAAESPHLLDDDDLERLASLTRGDA